MNVYTAHRRRYEADTAHRFLSEAFERLTAEQQFAQILCETLQTELSRAASAGEFLGAA